MDNQDSNFHRDLLDSDKFGRSELRFIFQTKRNSLFDPHVQLIKRTSLGVATLKCGHTCYQPSFGITFDYHVEFLLHDAGSLIAFRIFGTFYSNHMHSMRIDP